MQCAPLTHAPLANAHLLVTISNTQTTKILVLRMYNKHLRPCLHTSPKKLKLLVVKDGTQKSHMPQKEGQRGKAVFKTVSSLAVLEQ